ncbi:MAG: hypothetical protein CM1200mP10_17640 [Candidatus Neomarinimicrobiota bacterium]|nr:MAG: hypothetical protein CM1200mP10_17640 [Candidatus Neomarinimicrobiota bacterium]
MNYYGQFTPFIPQSADSLQEAKNQILSSPLVEQTLISNDGSFGIYCHRVR